MSERVMGGHNFLFLFIKFSDLGMSYFRRKTRILPQKHSNWEVCTQMLNVCKTSIIHEEDKFPRTHNFLTLTTVLYGEGNGNPLQYSCLENPMDRGAWWAAVRGVARSWTQLSSFTFTFHFHALEKEMATHSSDLAWRIPGTVGPGGLLSMRSHRVRHDWSGLAAAAAAVLYSSLTLK